MIKIMSFCVLCLLTGCGQQPEVRAQQPEVGAQVRGTAPRPGAAEFDTVAVDTTATGDPSNPNVFSKGRLEGEFFVSGPIDEGSLAKGRSHYYAWFEGKSAFELYRAIPGEPQEYSCEDGHAWSKSSGQILCTASADFTSFSCYFAIDVPKTEFEVGYVC